MASALGPDKTLSAINLLANQREERRKTMEEFKRRRASEARELVDKGKYGDSDFVGMIEKYRGASTAVQNKQPYTPGQGRINVAVRKRPASEREETLQDYDTVTCANPYVIVHACKMKVDGITKNLENTQFEFDCAFDEMSTNDDVYGATCLPLVQFVALEDGRSTVFAYGQTGSGKTFTMQGLQERVARDIFRHARSRATKAGIVRIKCSNFELYGAQCLDLLNDRRLCAVREDGQGDIHIDGLVEEEASDEDEFLSILQRGASVRTTRATEMNADSSRSHAIFQVTLSTGGKLSLIDLAGSERGQDVKSHDQLRQQESANINKSLLALKECIRALDPASGKSHVPYRQSKLTMVLKDSFAPESRTVMISCVSPAASSSDHTLNTLRYADRVKAKGSHAGHREPVVSVTSLKSPGVQKGKVLLGGAVARQSMAPTNNGLRAKSPGLAVRQVPTKTTLQQRPQVRPAPLLSKSPKASKQNSSVLSSTSGLDTSGFSLLSSKSGLGRASYIDSDFDDDDVMSDERDEEENHLPPQRSSEYVASTSRVAPTTVQSQSGREKRIEQPVMVPSSTSTASPQTVAPVSVMALLDEEEALLDAYSQAVQQNFRLITEESNILTEIDSVVDYDIEVYTDKLRVLLEQKLKIFGELHTKLLVFQDHLHVEEQYAMGIMQRQ